jgi:ribosomal protein S6
LKNLFKFNDAIIRYLVIGRKEALTNKSVMFKKEAQAA